MGALGRGDHVEMLQCDPRLCPGEAQGRAGTGLGGTQLTLWALVGGPDGRAFFFFCPGGQADFTALSQRISPLVKKLGQSGEGNARAE